MSFGIVRRVVWKNLLEDSCVSIISIIGWLNGQTYSDIVDSDILWNVGTHPPFIVASRKTEAVVPIMTEVLRCTILGEVRNEEVFMSGLKKEREKFKKLRM
jgi:hypothetical protein